MDELISKHIQEAPWCMLLANDFIMVKEREKEGMEILNLILSYEGKLMKVVKANI